MVRRPSSASRYDPEFTVKATKYPGSVMELEAFSRYLDWAGLYFFPKNVTMKEPFTSTV